jgi:hypothetical protein
MLTENPVLHRLDDQFITLHTFVNYVINNITFVAILINVLLFKFVAIL